jgi:hypothetical protein
VFLGRPGETAVQTMEVAGPHERHARAPRSGENPDRSAHYEAHHGLVRQDRAHRMPDEFPIPQALKGPLGQDPGDVMSIKCVQGQAPFAKTSAVRIVISGNWRYSVGKSFT